MRETGKAVAMRLNPCSNGILKYGLISFNEVVTNCLNPCSNGILKYFYKNLKKNNYES